MKTQLELAKEGIITDDMAAVAKDEGLAAETVRQGVAAGQIVIPVNSRRPGQKVCGIGKGLRTKVNASIGTSSDISDVGLEIGGAGHGRVGAASGGIGLGYGSMIAPPGIPCTPGRPVTRRAILSAASTASGPSSGRWL